MSKDTKNAGYAMLLSVVITVTASVLPQILLSAGRDPVF